jgi:sec-independent protein translocase protein TatA
MQASLLFLGSIGTTEILVILFIVLLLFGAKKIPELARGLGRGIREFKDASKEIKKNIEEEVQEKR